MLRCYLQDFRDAITRYYKFIKAKKRPPHFVMVRCVQPPCQNYRLIPVDIEDFRDAMSRYNRFVDANSRPPNYVDITLTHRPNIHFYVFRPDRQDNRVSCGPSSLRMVLSTQGVDVPEDDLRRLLRTSTSGTSPDAFRDAVPGVSGLIKKQVHIQELPTDNLSMDDLSDWILLNIAVIFHVRTLPYLRTDFYGRPVWRSDFGHYCVLYGVDAPAGGVYIHDPTKGLVKYNFKDFVSAMRMTNDKTPVRCFWVGGCNDR